MKSSCLLGLACLLVVCCASACVPSLAAAPAADQAATSGKRDQQVTLKVYTRVTNITQDIEQQLITEFEARHGVKVELTSGDDPDLYARFTVEAKNGVDTAEVFAGWNPVGVLQLEQQGLLQAYVPPSLASRIPTRFQDPVVIQHAGLSALAYNPQKLGSTQPPASYADLTKPEFKDRIEMVDPIVSSTYLNLMGHLAYSSPLGWSYWNQLHANGLRLVGTTDQVNKDIENPDSPVAVGVVGFGTAYPDERAGKAIEVVIPAEGLVAGEYVVAVARNAKHPDLARAYVEEVTFNPRLLDAWSKRYLPVTVQGLPAPDGTPPLDRIVITNWSLLQQKELEIKTQWQTIATR